MINSFIRLVIGPGIIENIYIQPLSKYLQPLRLDTFLGVTENISQLFGCFQFTPEQFQVSWHRSWHSIVDLIRLNIIFGTSVTQQEASPEVPLYDWNFISFQHQFLSHELRYFSNRSDMKIAPKQNFKHRTLLSISMISLEEKPLLQFHNIWS